MNKNRALRIWLSLLVVVYSTFGGVVTSRFTDNFSDRETLTGFTNFIMGNNSAWTKEPGEINHADAQGGHSGWINWLAPASGECVLQTMTTGLPGISNTFDTVLAVYTGTTLSNLVHVSSNDDATNTATLQSYLAFRAVLGSTYQIALDGFNRFETGNFYFRLSMSNPYPFILTQPQSQTVNQGATVTFSVLAGGPGPLSYQWQRNANNITNATNAILTLVNVQSTDEGLYTVLVGNPTGSITSAPASLTVRLRPAITAQPQARLVNPGEAASFAVTATGTPPLFYSWYVGGTFISGATDSTYTCVNTTYTNAGSYYVRVTNMVGTAQSASAELNVRPRFLASSTLSNGVFVLDGEGVRGKSYLVEFTRTLTNWTSLGTVSNANIQMQFSDTNAATSPRFYRFRQAPTPVPQ